MPNIFVRTASEIRYYGQLYQKLVEFTVYGVHALPLR